MTEQTLITKAKRLFHCDSVRIRRFGHTPQMFVILGWKVKALDGVEEVSINGQWVNQNGEPRRFEYLDEKCVASGYSLKELWEDIRRYRRACLLDKIKDPVKRVMKMLEVPV